MDDARIFFVFNSLGRIGFFSALSHATLLVGNSSSGIIEAASFNCPVVNIGDRQKGREQSKNVVNCTNNLNDIKLAIQKAEKMVGQTFENIYFKEKTIETICQFLKTTNLTLDMSFFEAPSMGEF